MAGPVKLGVKNKAGWAWEGWRGCFRLMKWHLTDTWRKGERGASGYVGGKYLNKRESRSKGPGVGVCLAC